MNIYLQIIEILKLIQFIRSGCINFSISTEQKNALFFLASFLYLESHGREVSIKNEIHYYSCAVEFR